MIPRDPVELANWLARKQGGTHADVRIVVRNGREEICYVVKGRPA